MRNYLILFFVIFGFIQKWGITVLAQKLSATVEKLRRGLLLCCKGWTYERGGHSRKYLKMFRKVDRFEGNSDVLRKKKGHCNSRAALVSKSAD